MLFWLRGTISAMVILCFGGSDQIFSRQPIAWKLFSRIIRFGSKLSWTGEALNFGLLSMKSSHSIKTKKLLSHQFHQIWGKRGGKRREREVGEGKKERGREGREREKPNLRPCHKTRLRTMSTLADLILSPLSLNLSLSLSLSNAHTHSRSLPFSSF